MFDLLGSIVMLLIRTFKAQDAKNISNLIRKTMSVSNSKDYPAERLKLLIAYFSPEKVVKLSKERVCLVAESENRLIGTIALEGNELLTFFVHPDFQTRGVGTQLLDAIEKLAISHEVTLLTCKASITAVPFYTKKGYKRTGLNKDGTAGKQIGMKKSLLVTEKE